MMKYFRLTTILLVFAFAAGALTSPNPAMAASAAEIDRDAQKASGGSICKIPFSQDDG